jgi:hypothetical protein
MPEVTVDTQLKNYGIIKKYKNKKTCKENAPRYLVRENLCNTPQSSFR